MEEFLKHFQEHEKADEKRFGDILEALTKIKDNHLFHMQRSMSAMTTDIAWLKYGIILVIASLVGLILKK